MAARCGPGAQDARLIRGRRVKCVARRPHLGRHDIPKLRLPASVPLRRRLQHRDWGLHAAGCAGAPRPVMAAAWGWVGLWGPAGVPPACWALPTTPDQMAGQLHAAGKGATCSLLTIRPSELPSSSCSLLLACCCPPATF